MDEPFTIVHAGDAALVVDFEERIDDAINARAVQLADILRAHRVHGVRDVVPAFRSVAVYFDPLTTDVAALRLTLRDLAGRPGAPVADVGDVVRIPVVYGGEFGPDLAHVAEAAGLSEDDVVRIHSEATYRVFMLGFLPGFAYMATLDARIQLPRRETPRTRVAAGSVAIAAAQTGIYPLDTPGGWHVIGRTPLRPFDPARQDPFLFKPGDRVRFDPASSSFEGSPS